MSIQVIFGKHKNKTGYRDVYLKIMIIKEIILGRLVPFICIKSVGFYGKKAEADNIKVLLNGHSWPNLKTWLEQQ